MAKRTSGNSVTLISAGTNAVSLIRIQHKPPHPITQIRRGWEPSIIKGVRRGKPRLGLCRQGWAVSPNQGTANRKKRRGNDKKTGLLITWTSDKSDGTKDKGFMGRSQPAGVKSRAQQRGLVLNLYLSVNPCVSAIRARRVEGGRVLAASRLRRRSWSDG